MLFTTTGNRQREDHEADGCTTSAMEKTEANRSAIRLPGSSPAPTEPLPPAKLHLLKVPQASLEPVVLIQATQWLRGKLTCVWFALLVYSNDLLQL